MGRERRDVHRQPEQQHGRRRARFRRSATDRDRRRFRGRRNDVIVEHATYDPVSDSLHLLAKIRGPATSTVRPCRAARPCTTTSSTCSAASTSASAWPDTITMFDPSAAEGARWTTMTATLPTSIAATFRRHGEWSDLPPWRIDLGSEYLTILDSAESPSTSRLPMRFSPDHADSADTAETRAVTVPTAPSGCWAADASTESKQRSGCLRSRRRQLVDRPGVRQCASQLRRPMSILRVATSTRLAGTMSTGALSAVQRELRRLHPDQRPHLRGRLRRALIRTSGNLPLRRPVATPAVFS